MITIWVAVRIKIVWVNGGKYIRTTHGFDTLLP